MTDTLKFALALLTPFRIGTHHGGDGTHVTLDTDEPVNGDHLKGLMNAAARYTLQVRKDVADSVFGSPANPCPWNWSAAEPDNGWATPRQRNRVRIDPDRHAAAEDQLVFADQLPATHATFTVSRHRNVPASDLACHLLILRCSGAAVHGLGGWRNRGLGWVGITPDHAITADDVAALGNLMQER